MSDLASSDVLYAICPSPLGALLVAVTARGLCAVALGEDESALESDLRAQQSQAERVPASDPRLGRFLPPLLAYLGDKQPLPDLPLDVPGTPFQQRVWAELRRIPYGETRTYTEIAQALGQPEAVRAVAHACASNPAALVIPCHRVLRGDGAMGGFRWGLERKVALLQSEGALF